MRVYLSLVITFLFSLSIMEQANAVGESFLFNPASEVSAIQITHKNLSLIGQPAAEEGANDFYGTLVFNGTDKGQKELLRKLQEEVFISLNNKVMPIEPYLNMTEALMEFKDKKLTPVFARHGAYWDIALRLKKAGINVIMVPRITSFNANVSYINSLVDDAKKFDAETLKIFDQPTPTVVRNLLKAGAAMTWYSKWVNNPTFQPNGEKTPLYNQIPDDSNTVYWFMNSGMNNLPLETMQQQKLVQPLVWAPALLFGLFEAVKFRLTGTFGLFDVIPALAASGIGYWATGKTLPYTNSLLKANNTNPSMEYVFVRPDKFSIDSNRVGGAVFMKSLVDDAAVDTSGLSTEWAAFQRRLNGDAPKEFITDRFRREEQEKDALMMETVRFPTLYFSTIGEGKDEFEALYDMGFVPSQMIDNFYRVEEWTINEEGSALAEGVDRPLKVHNNLEYAHFAQVPGFHVNGVPFDLAMLEPGESRVLLVLPQDFRSINAEDVNAYLQGKKPFDVIARNPEIDAKRQQVIEWYRGNKQKVEDLLQKIMPSLPEVAEDDPYAGAQERLAGKFVELRNKFLPFLKAQGGDKAVDEQGEEVGGVDMEAFLESLEDQFKNPPEEEK